MGEDRIKENNKYEEEYFWYNNDKCVMKQKNNCIRKIIVRKTNFQ